MKNDPIISFIGEYRFLSNFYPAPIQLDDLIFPTTEHAYQAMKSDDPQVWKQVAALRTPGEAKRFGRKIQISPSFEASKLRIMTSILNAKFQHQELAQLLIATGERELIEGNTWGDQYWGVCNGSGKNHLGRILMTIRDDLKS